MKKKGQKKDLGLTAEDRAIWQRVTRTVTPSRSRSRKLNPDAAPKESITPKEIINRGPFMRVTPAQNAHIQKANKPIEPTADKRVRRGRIQIDRRIDLHDMTRDQAQPALFNAVRAAYARGEKCMLVITGKGLRLNGVLRQNFPIWINSDDIRPMIASYAGAHIRHGGTGAWYVFLKRNKPIK